MQFNTRCFLSTKGLEVMYVQIMHVIGNSTFLNRLYKEDTNNLILKTCVCHSVVNSTGTLLEKKLTPQLSEKHKLYSSELLN